MTDTASGSSAGSTESTAAETTEAPTANASPAPAPATSGDSAPASSAPVSETTTADDIPWDREVEVEGKRLKLEELKRAHVEADRIRKEMHKAKWELAQAKKAQDAEKARWEAAAKNPGSLAQILAERGLQDPYGAAESLVAQRLQWEQMTPEQREYQKMRAEMEAWQQQKEHEAQETARREQEAQQKEIEQRDRQGLTSAMEKLQFKGGERVTDAVMAYAEDILDDIRVNGSDGTYRTYADIMRAAIDAYRLEQAEARALLTKEDKRALIDDELRAELEREILEKHKSRQVQPEARRDPQTGQFTAANNGAPPAQKVFRMGDSESFREMLRNR
jgi:hypothetical protein